MLLSLATPSIHSCVERWTVRFVERFSGASAKEKKIKHKWKEFWKPKESQQPTNTKKKKSWKNTHTHTQQLQSKREKKTRISLLLTSKIVARRPRLLLLLASATAGGGGCCCLSLLLWFSGGAALCWWWFFLVNFAWRNTRYTCVRACVCVSVSCERGGNKKN